MRRKLERKEEGRGGGGGGVRRGGGDVSGKVLEQGPESGFGVKEESFCAVRIELERKSLIEGLKEGGRLSRQTLSGAASID